MAARKFEVSTLREVNYTCNSIITVMCFNENTVCLFASTCKLKIIYQSGASLSTLIIGIICMVNINIINEHIQYMYAIGKTTAPAVILQLVNATILCDTVISVK